MHSTAKDLAGARLARADRARLSAGSLQSGATGKVIGELHRRHRSQESLQFLRTIDEAVPMLFRMGPDGLEVASYVKSGREFRARACRGSLGVSTDEDFSRAILSGAVGQRTWLAKRIYVFSAKPWTDKDAKAVSTEVAKWHRE